jgi:hypothetical protein
MTNPNNTIKKIINWNGLSVVLSGKKFKVRFDRKSKDHKEVVESLLEHLEAWANENKIDL